MKNQLSQTTWGGWTPDEEEMLEEDNASHEAPKENDTSAFAFKGTYAARVETELTTSGMAQITYQFTFRGNSVQLETMTTHEQIRCNGRYKMVDENGLQAMYYTGDEASCDKNKPLFFLQEKKGKLFARGLGGEGTINEWIRLKKEK